MLTCSLTEQQHLNWFGTSAPVNEGNKQKPLLLHFTMRPQFKERILPRMTTLSFKAKRRGGGCSARERHIVFKLKLNCCFPGRSLSLLPVPGDGGQVTG